MKLDKPYSSDLFDETYVNYKYFNQRPWDIAMNRKVHEEYEYFKKTFYQDVINGIRDENEYLVLLKLSLDSPMIYFKPDEDETKELPN